MNEQLPSFEETEELPSFEQTEALPSFEDTKDIVAAPQQEFSNNQVSDTQEQDKPDVLSQIGATVAGTMSGAAAAESLSRIPTAVESGTLKLASFLSPYSEDQLRFIKENYPQYSTATPTTAAKKLEEAAQLTNQKALDLEKQAYAPLRNQIITPKEYKNLVLETATTPDNLGRPLARPISEEVINDVKQKATTGMSELMGRMDEQSLREFAELKALEAVNSTKMSGMGQVPEEALNAVYDKTKEQVLKNPTEFEFQAKRNPMALMDEYFSLKDKGIVEKSSMPDVFPELVGKTMTSTEERDLRKMMAMASQADIPADELYNINQSLAEMGYNPEGGVRSEVPAMGQRVVRKRVETLNPQASDLFKQEGEQIRKLEALENAGYIQRGDISKKAQKNFITLDTTQMQKIFKDLANTDRDKLTPVIERLQMLKEFVDPAIYKELELGALKAIENKDTISYISKNPTNKILQAFEQPKIARMIVTAPEAIATNFPKTTAVAKKIAGAGVRSLPLLGGGIVSLAANAAAEATDVETSGATPDMPDYWLEKGVRDPEEQVQQARLSSFKAGLPNQGQADKIPSAYDKPQVKQYKEAVLQADKQGKLKPNYVEKFESTDTNDINNFMNFLTAEGDRVGEEYVRVLSQIADAPDREKAATLFSLNQNLAFREKAKKFKGKE